MSKILTLAKPITIAFLLLGAGACATATPTPSPTLQPTSTVTTAPTTALPTVTPAATATASMPVVTSPVIQSFLMLGSSNGWALTQTGVIQTTDGGVTWHDATPPGYPATTGKGFFMPDFLTVWVLVPTTDFSAGTLYQTVDSGHSWTSVSVPFSMADMHFIDLHNGFALADLGAGAGSEGVALYQTADSGTTWIRNYINDPTVAGAGSTLPLGGIKSGMYFLNLNTGWVAGSIPVDNFVYLYVTHDSGVTWAQQAVVIPPSSVAVQFSVDPPIFFDPLHGVLPAAVFDGGSSRIFFVTSDGGNTWMPTSAVPGLGEYSVVSPTIAFVWDGGPALSASSDGMLNWNSIATNMNDTGDFSAMQFIDNLNGWALFMNVSGHASLYRTNDGGAIWNPLIP